jgi:hypothetical protein
MRMKKGVIDESLLYNQTFREEHHMDVTSQTRDVFCCQSSHPISENMASTLNFSSFSQQHE